MQFIIYICYLKISFSLRRSVYLCQTISSSSVELPLTSGTLSLSTVCFWNQTFHIVKPSKVVTDISCLFTHLLWLGACPNAAHIGTTFFVIVILRTDVMTLRAKSKMLRLSQHLSQGVDTDCSSYSSAVNASASSPQTHLPTDITQNSKLNQS